MVRLDVNGKIEEDKRTVADEFSKYFSNMADLEGTKIQVTVAELTRHKISCK